MLDNFVYLWRVFVYVDLISMFKLAPKLAIYIRYKSTGIMNRSFCAKNHNRKRIDYVNKWVSYEHDQNAL